MKSSSNNDKGEILLYKGEDKKEYLEVRLQKDTVWLSLNQLSELFDRNKSVISRHLRNIIETGELKRNQVVANFATTATDGKTYQVDYYNLDAIISVGYRVNSKRGTQFRIWATDVLRNHLIKGYTLNQKRLAGQIENYKELQRAIHLIGEVIHKQLPTSEQVKGLLHVITDFAYALEVLDAYDYQKLTVEATTKGKAKAIDYQEAHWLIDQLRNQYRASNLFGKEKDRTLESSLGNIYQTFDGKELYPSIEEKAAHLLYFLVKNHHFIDGNKRIAASLFLWFLEKNKALYRADGSKRIADNALVAITLMIAESNPKHKDMIVKVIVNLINKKNT